MQLTCLCVTITSIISVVTCSCPDMSVAGLEVLFECKDAASLSAKRQLGQKTAATSRPCACLIACREGCAALTDGWGGGQGSDE